MQLDAKLVQGKKYPEKLTVSKGVILSEDIGGFLPLPKNIPKNYLKLSYPVHGNDKVLVVFNRLHVKKYYIY